MVKKRKPLRYIEISRRNPVTKLLLGYGSTCNRSLSCDSACIEIHRAGHKDCCEPQCDYCNNPCCPSEPKPLCPTLVAKVCAIDVDDDGYAIFEWPADLMNLKEGWYEGRVTTDGCYECAVLPLRIGPRCNVLEVETVVIGPDNACLVGCEDECLDTICPTNRVTQDSDQKTYIPTYEVF